MGKVVHCDCGFVVRGASDDEIVASVQTHAKEAHGLDVTREHALAMAVVADD